MKQALRNLGLNFSARNRIRRGQLFCKLFPLGPNSHVLDLGGGTGAHIRSVLGDLLPASQVCIADVSERDLAGAAEHGHPTRLIQESGPLPFADREFDVLFCSSVIEHVTGNKATLWSQRDSAFAQRAFACQSAFAAELSRVTKQFWVQTPAKSFPVETHLWLPIVHWLPRATQVAACKWTLEHWPHGTIPDFNLLTHRQMISLFPEATIYRERFCGITKSWIAIKRQPPDPALS